jgi:hypothetical protein
MGRAKLVFFILIFNFMRYNLHLPALIKKYKSIPSNGSNKAG